jgi:hypothetical protein
LRKQIAPNREISHRQPLPGFGPEIEADDLDSVSIYTAGIPAEYGRKLGGVVELNTRRDTQAGLHGQMVLGGGSYDTLQSFGQLQDTWGKNTLFASASGSGASHYKSEKINSRFQADGDNLNNRLNVIDFGGLFSGNAIGPARSFSLRLNTSF